MRKVKPSREAIKLLGKKKKFEIVGKFPICPHGHPSWEARKEVIEHIAKLKRKGRIEYYMEDVCDKTGKKKFSISCAVCGQKQGTIWAKDKTLKDWCSFRYEQWYDKEGWRGCLTPNISPVTGVLTLECCCGNDTREFLISNHPRAAEIEIENRKGREYGKEDSKFLVKEVQNG